MDVARWKSAAREREYFQLYSALRQEAWPSPPVERDIETRFGSTHVFAWEGTGTPLVLLHGAGTSSLMWAPLIAELTGFAIFAIEVVGEPNLSAQIAPLTGADDFVAWFLEVLDGLHIERAHACGASYGGWIGCHVAIQAPQRVATLMLVEPALDQVRPYFWVHSALVGLSSVLPSSARRPLMRRLHMEAAGEADPRVIKLARMGFTQFKRALPRATPVTDAELTSIATPTLLLLGAKSEIHHARALYERARANLPRVDAELVPDAGHSLPLDRPALVGARIRAFVTTS
jgi:pimeloyl-ACP methyl ester carboxylesterase